MEKFISIRSLLKEEESLCNSLNRWQDDLEKEKERPVRWLMLDIEFLNRKIDYSFKYYYQYKNYAKDCKRRHGAKDEVTIEWREYAKKEILEARQYQKELAEKKAQLDALNNAQRPEDVLEYRQKLQELKEVRAEIKKLILCAEDYTTKEE